MTQPVAVSQRLADRILVALELAVHQGDAETGRLLARALELSMTRQAGGAEFVERRSFSTEVEQALSGLAAIPR